VAAWLKRADTRGVCFNGGMSPALASSTTRAAAFVLAAALLFGASTPLAKQLLATLGPFTLAGLLYLGAALGALPFATRGGSPALRRDRGQRRNLALAVLFGGGIAPVLLLLGLRMAPAASVALWLNAEVVATAVLAWALFREPADRRTLTGAVLVVAGGVLLAVGPGGAAGWRAGALVAAACACWGVDNNLTAVVSAFTPAQTTVAKGAIAGSVNLALGLAAGQHLPGPAGVGAALAVGAVGYGLSLVLYISGAQQLGALRAQLLFAASPFLGVALAWTVFAERVQVAQLWAAPCIAAGIVLALAARHAHVHAHEAM